jgi:hypothetical protein
LQQAAPSGQQVVPQHVAPAAQQVPLQTAVVVLLGLQTPLQQLSPGAQQAPAQQVRPVGQHS